jgi:hypothetical protein
MRRDHTRSLVFLWILFAALSAALTVICAIYLEGKSFSPSPGVSVFRGARDPSYGLIFLLGAIINGIFVLIYHIDPDGKLMPKLNIPGKEFWLETPERRELLSLRLKRIFSALGAYIDFLIASTLYMTLHYFYPHSLPCPRHILMILLWTFLTFAVGIYTLLQFKRPL